MPTGFGRSSSLFLTLTYSFLVIFPAVIQLLVGKANLPINGGVFLANSPTTAIVSINTALSIPAGIKATLDPVTLYLYSKKTAVFSPFLGLEIGKTQLDGYTEVNIADKLVTILNQTEMESWFEGVVQNSQTALSVKGSTKVHLGALNYNVNIDKTQNIPTLNNLAGLGFGGLSLVLPADTDGTNFKGNLTLPNSSPLTIGLGNLTLNILSGPVLIGILRLQDVVAPPGNTSLAFRGELYFDAILQNLGPIIQSQASAIKDGNLNVSASGNSSLINGQHITYIENVLNKQVLSTQIPILTLVTQLAGSLLSGGTTLSNLGSLLGGLLGNLTGTSTSTSNISSLLGIFGSSLNVASVVSMVSKSQNS